MNQVSYNDFGLFETEKLSVDYICLNLPNQSKRIALEIPFTGIALFDAFLGPSFPGVSPCFFSPRNLSL